MIAEMSFLQFNYRLLFRCPSSFVNLVGGCRFAFRQHWHNEAVSDYATTGTPRCIAKDCRHSELCSAAHKWCVLLPRRLGLSKGFRFTDSATMDIHSSFYLCQMPHLLPTMPSRRDVLQCIRLSVSIRRSLSECTVSGCAREPSASRRHASSPFAVKFMSNKVCFSHGRLRSESPHHCAHYSE